MRGGVEEGGIGGGGEERGIGGGGRGKQKEGKEGE